ncbi:MAG TPA: glycosyltransferase family 4 protein [Candidatus Saccharimonadales bacterium]|jgi:glycosyltransferase involved in cell wall biosynthesis|nr:glycosyltransferase family 4 protein [Candidatus Saccharimonadales bacterium]
MKIAQVAPLYESVPPKLYGGTERVVSYLTEALVEAGHEVTLFASGDSETSARLIPGCPKALRLNNYECQDQLAHHFVMLEEVLERAEQFDIIHFHVDYMHFPLSRLSGLVHVSTLHGRLDSPDLVPLYRKYKNMPVTSISLSQRKPLPWVNWIGNVYHGLPADLLPLGSGRGKYLAFLGRISPEKRADRAIEIAQRLNMPLKIAAKVDPADRVYYEREIKHLLNTPNVEFIGEINEQQKGAFLGDAYAYLFPIDWPEPFGLTMIESMACGTPTIAFNCGSVPEVITHGVTGFIVDTVDEAVNAVQQAAVLDRAACRAEFMKRFSAPKMAQQYVKLYEASVRAKSAVPYSVSADPDTEIDSLLTL